MNYRKYMHAVLFAMFFTMAFVTNILGPIIPDIIRSYHLGYSAAALLPFSFFIAYGIFSIPSGFLAERWGEKRVILLTFSVASFGSLLFASIHTYPVAIISLFLIGSAMAALQVAINPLLRVVGGERNLPRNSSLSQLVCGIASFAGPWTYTAAIRLLQSVHSQPIRSILFRMLPESMQWVSLYWLFSLLFIAMLLVTVCSAFPAIKRNAEESAGTAGMYRVLFRRPFVWIYFISVFAYVGVEQDISNWMSTYLWKYHGSDPHTEGAVAVAQFWALFTIGCLVGVVLLQYIGASRILSAAASGTLLSLVLALFGPSAVSKLAFPLTGLFASVIWPLLLSMALNSIEEYHGVLAGILCTGITGGAIFPLLTGRIADHLGLRMGLSLMFINLLWILGVSLLNLDPPAQHFHRN